MFPLGAPLLPGMVLPLRLFEPRYLELYAAIIDTTREFGVVLIERGSETGPGSTFDIGCTAAVVGSGVNDDGTIGVIALGGHRFEIESWLEPAPYPRAFVSDLDDAPLSHEGLLCVRKATDLLPRLLEIAARLNPGVETDVPELADDPALVTYQIAQLAGLQPLDLQAVLETSQANARACLVKEKVEETIELIRLQLEIGDA